jgi:membrane protease YdiL (CAAX protease family)
MTEERVRFHETTIGVFVVSFVLMIIAGLENSVVPWAPFYIVYATLATLLPLKWKTYHFGSIKDVPWWWWVICPVLAILLQAFVTTLLNAVYLNIAVKAGGVEVMDDPLIGVDAMLNAMFAATGEHLGIAPETAKFAYLAFVVAWAGLGEELYFRGYVQGALRKRHSARYAILVAAALFAIRHYMQMLLLLPKYPVFAASAWVTAAFPVGIVLGLIYERNKSLWVPVVIHYLFNLIAILGAIVFS